MNIEAAALLRLLCNADYYTITSRDGKIATRQVWTVGKILDLSGEAGEII